MLELFAAVSLLAVIGLALCGYMIVNLRDQRDEALQDLTIARGDIKSLTNRCTELRGEVITQQKSIDVLRDGLDGVVAQRDQLQRELGRIEAERRAAKLTPPAKHPEGTIAFKPKRDAKGKFLPKPKAPKPAKAAKPIACG